MLKKEKKIQQPTFRLRREQRRDHKPQIIKRNLQEAQTISSRGVNCRFTPSNNTPLLPALILPLFLLNYNLPFFILSLPAPFP